MCQDMNPVNAYPGLISLLKWEPGCLLGRMNGTLQNLPDLVVFNGQA